MIVSRYLVVGVLLSLLCAICVPTQAVPSPRAEDPPVHLTFPQARTFKDALRTLSEQSSTAFVAEGWPLHPTLPERRAIPWADKVVSLSVAVQGLAESYDYTAQRQGKVFLFTKRYTDSTDLPGVTLAECRASVEDIREVTRPFNPQVPPEKYGVTDPLVGDLVASFTPQQIQAMAGTAPGKRLAVSTLTPEQQAQVWRFLLYFYVQLPLQPAENVWPDLKEAVRPGAKLAFRRGDFFGLALFGYESAPFITGGQGFHPLSNPNNRINVDAGGTVSILTTPHPIAGPDGVKRLPEDPTDPSPAEIEAAKTAPTGATLGRIVTLLNMRPGTHVKFVVDAMVRAKPITVVGEETTAPEKILEAMGDVYGLRVKTDQDGTKRLTRRLFQVPLSVLDLPEAVRCVFPTPFLRALHTDSADNLADQYRLYTARLYQKQPPSDDQGGVRPADAAQAEADFSALKKTGDKQRELDQQMKAYLPALRSAAVRRLRAWADPEIKLSSNGRVLLSQGGEQEQEAFAAIMMVQSLQGVQTLLSQRVPECITNFDQLYLTGGVETDEHGRKFFGFFAEPGGAGISIALDIHTLTSLEQ